MKIAQIAPPWITIPPKNYGGTESVIFQLVEQLVAQGHDVTLFAPGDTKTSAKLVSFFPKALLQEGVPWTMHLKPFYHLQKALEEVSKQDFDIVHTHLSSAADMYIFPLTAHLATSHVTTLHSCFPFDRGSNNWVGDSDGYYMDWASYIPMVAISESAKAQVHFPLNFVGVVYNGIELPAISTRRKRQGEHFVWLGRFVPEKGAHLAIEAAKRAGVPITLAGTIDRYVQESGRYFHKKIEPQIDNDRVKYIGPVNMKQKLNLLSHARGFLNPIEWEEPFGMVMVEAMMLACPVISFDRGAARELLVDGKTGYLVQNLDEMVQAIPRIDEIDREVTRKHAEEHFSAQRMAENYVQAYQKVIAMSKASAKDVENDKKKHTEVAAPA